MTIIQRMVDAPGVCVLLAMLLGITACVTLAGLAGALLQMHRSKTAVQKIYKNETFLRKLMLRPAWEQCIHAKGFCRKVIVLYWARGILLAALGIMGLLQIGSAVSYFALGQVLLLDVPIYIIHGILSKPHWFRRWRGSRFEKYHNTQEHERLF